MDCDHCAISHINKDCDHCVISHTNKSQYISLFYSVSNLLEPGHLISVFYVVLK